MTGLTILGVIIVALVTLDIMSSVSGPPAAGPETDSDGPVMRLPV